MNVLLLVSLVLLATDSIYAKANTKDTKPSTKSTSKAKTGPEEEASPVSINDRIVATVMGTNIRQSQVMQFLQMSYDLSKMKPEDIEPAFKQVLELLISMHLINKLYSQEYNNNKDYTDAIETAKASATYQYYAQKFLSGKTAEDLEAYYNHKKQSMPLPMRYTAIACNCKKKEHADEIISNINKGSTPAKALESINKQYSTKYSFRTLQDEYGNEGATVFNIKNAPNEVKLALSKYNAPISSDKAMVHQATIKTTDRSGSNEYAVLYIQEINTGTIDDLPAYNEKFNQQLSMEMLQDNMSDLAKKYDDQITIAVSNITQP